MNISNRIKKIRISKKITQEELASRIHKTVSSVKKYESGDISLNIDTLNDIANALDVSLAYLVIDDKIDLFNMFVYCNNLQDLPAKEKSVLKIEFNMFVDYLIFKHTK